MKIEVHGLIHIKDGRISDPTDETELYLHMTVSSRRTQSSYMLYNLRTREAWFSMATRKHYHYDFDKLNPFGKHFQCDEETKELFDRAFELYVAGHKNKEITGLKCLGTIVGKNHTVAIRE